MPLYDTSAGSFAPGTELDYAQRVTNVTFTVETDIVVGNPVVYDGSTRIKLEFLAGAVDNIAGVITRFYDATTALNRVGDQRTSQVDIMIYAALFLVPSAGSHTFKTTLTPVSSGTTVVNAGALSGGASTYAPVWMRITVA